MIEHIIFDCDGVLIDTEIVAAEIAVKWLHTQQVDITVEQFIREHTGKTFTGILNQLREEKQLPADLDVHNTMLAMEAEIRNNMRPIAGVNAMLEQIDLPKSVVSNSNVDYVEEALHKFSLTDHFNSTIFSAELVAQAKPSPMVYQLALDTIGLTADKVVAIEDSYTGVQASTSAGIRTIGFLGGSHILNGHGERLKSLGVIGLASSHEELAEMLLTL
ncbi:MAG: HAD family phosphatase [Roseivirga sp.]|nr:HAD family phosphatase [Roseivirga sp.]